MSYYYVVGSEEQVATLRTAINGAMMSAFTNGYVPNDYHVVAGDSPESEVLVALMFQDLNGVQAQTGLFTVTTVDLR